MSNDSSRRYEIGEAVQVRYAGHWHMGAVYNRSRDDEAREWYAVNFTFDNGNTGSTLLHSDEIAARLRPLPRTCTTCGHDTGHDCELSPAPYMNPANEINCNRWTPRH